MANLDEQPGVVVIREQVINDGPSGLTFIIWRTSDGEGRIRVVGDLPFGNRDLQFDSDGNLIGRGTSVVAACPTGLRVVG